MIRLRKGAVITIVVLILVLLGFFVVKGYFAKMYEPMDAKDTTPITITIPKGSSVGHIASILYENGLIRNGTFFKKRVTKLGKDKEFRSGDFELSRSMSVNEMIELMTLKPVEVEEEGMKLVIPEGFERRQIAARIEEKGLGSKDVFLDLTSNKNHFDGAFEFLSQLKDGQSLEGYLFPATYEIAPGTSEEDIIRKMLEAFEIRYKKYMEGQEYHGLSLHEMIVLASIIEREAVIDEERPLMSACFYNRMKEGMPLQSCATVQFILGERKPNLTHKDLEIDSPFNTYKYQGLPPEPIASPGMKAIDAAMHPADVTYKFFVRTGEDGSHTFSNTYEEHLKAKENMK
ncbi:MAG: endolytic transglycosylase MltG [Tissierellia bacterium]|nr:endolytic transglycosylase MltG [Tissierellia bacterium]